MIRDFIKRHLPTVVFTAILLTGLFVILYKANSFPPAIHYDQITSPFVAELSQRGDFKPDMRTTINNAITLTGLTSRIIPRLRDSTHLNQLELAVKSPSMFFFFLSIPVWWGILKLLKFQLHSIIVFFALYIFSPMFILYSRFIPINAAFLFYTSLFIYFLLRTVLHEKLDALFFIFFLISIIFGIAAFYTHIVSIIIIAILYLTLFFIVTPLPLVKKFMTIKPSGLGFATFSGLLILALLIILFFGYYSYAGGSEAIEERQTYSSLIDIQDGDVLSTVTGAARRIGAYLDPRYFVLGINQFSQNTTSEFSEFLNPSKSVWLIQSVGPVGLAGIAVFLVPLFLTFDRKKNRSLASTVILGLFLGYIAIAVISKYDNPATARVLPLLMAIPLGVAYVVDVVKPASLTRFKQIFYYGGITFCLMISTFYTFSIMYTLTYFQSESGKFETGIKEVSQKILSINDLSHIRLYLHTPTWSAIRYLELYLGPDIINRTVTFNDPGFLYSVTSNIQEIPIFVTTDISDLTYVETSLSLNVFSYGKYHVGIPRSATMNPTTLAWITPTTIFSNEPVHYKRHAEYDEIYPTLQSYVYESTSDTTVLTDRADLASLYMQNVLDEATGEITGNRLTVQTPFLNDIRTKSYSLSSDLSDSVVIDTTDPSITSANGTYHFDDTGSSSMLYLHIPKVPSYTSYVISVISDNELGEPLSAAFYDETNKRYLVGYKINSSDYVFTYPESNQIIVTLINNAGATDTHAINTITGVELYGIKSANLSTEFYSDIRRDTGHTLTMLSPKTNTDLVYSIPQTCDTGTIVLEQPYTPFWKLYLDGSPFNADPELINGYVTGWTVDGDILCNTEEVSFSMN